VTRRPWPAQPPPPNPPPHPPKQNPTHRRTRYEGARTKDAFATFLKGKLEADKGFARVEALDALALKAGAAAKEDLKKLVGELEAAAGKLEGDAKANGEVYVKLAKKALEKVGWVGGWGGICSCGGEEGVDVRGSEHATDNTWNRTQQHQKVHQDCAAPNQNQRNRASSTSRPRPRASSA